MIITNREEVIDKAFGVFVRMNYEKASIITLAKACGVTKTGIVYYFPHKLDLFMAVADKYVLKMHEPENKFAAPADTLTEFIGQYVAGVAASMKRIVELIGDNSSPHDCSPNFYYFHFLSQVRMYYPGITDLGDNNQVKFVTNLDNIIDVVNGLGRQLVGWDNPFHTRVFDPNDRLAVVVDL